MSGLSLIEDAYRTVRLYMRCSMVIWSSVGSPAVMPDEAAADLVYRPLSQIALLSSSLDFDLARTSANMALEGHSFEVSVTYAT